MNFKILKMLFLTICLIALAEEAMGINSLELSQTSITTDFQGTIRAYLKLHSIGSTAKINLIIDADRNGVIGPLDWMIYTEDIADGQKPILGNPRTPFDEDHLVDGNMTILINFFDQNKPELQAIIKAEDEGGALTKTFSIIASPQPQTISGKVQSAKANIAGALVIAFNKINFQVVAQTVSNSSGFYQLQIPSPGDYYVFTLKPGDYLSQFMGASMAEVSLASGENKTDVNLLLLEGDRVIVGQIKDSSTGKGIPGVYLEAKTPEMEYLTAGISQTGGTILLKVKDGNWLISPNENDLAVKGYLKKAQDIEILVNGQDVFDLNITCPKMTAMITGRVLKVGEKLDKAKEEHLHKQLADAHISGIFSSFTSQIYKELAGKYPTYTPLSGFNLDGYEASLNLQAGSISDLEGRYYLGVVGGNWSVEMDNEELTANGFIPPQPLNVVISDNEVNEGNDFLIRELNCRVKGRLTEGSNPVAGIMITAESGEFHFGDLTASDGSYEIPIFAGIWRIWADPFALQAKNYVPPLFVDVSVNEGETVTVNLNVTKAKATIYGIVSDGVNPVQNIYLYGIVPSMDKLIFTKTSQNGSYTIKPDTGLWYVGIHEESATDMGYVCPPAVSFNVKENDLLNQNFLLKKATAVIRGTLIGDKMPLSEVNIRAQSESGYFASQKTSNAGIYTIRVFGDSWTVQPDAEELIVRGYVPPAQKKAVVQDGGEAIVDFVARRGTARFQGRLTDGKSPIPDISIYAFQEGGSYVRNKTNSNGFYTLDVIAGRWNISPASNELAGKGYLPILGKSEEIEDGETINVDFTTPQASAQIAGRTLDYKGNTIPMVFISAMETRKLIRIGINSDMEGRYTLPAIPGEWLAQAMKPGYNPSEIKSVNITSPGQSIPLDLILSRSSPPQLLVGGYLATNLSTNFGGHLDIFFWASDPDGDRVQQVELCYQGIPIGIVLNDAEGDGVFVFSAEIGPSELAVKILIEGVATDEWGAKSNIWPYLISH